MHLEGWRLRHTGFEAAIYSLTHSWVTQAASGPSADYVTRVFSCHW